MQCTCKGMLVLLDLLLSSKLCRFQSLHTSFVRSEPATYKQSSLKPQARARRSHTPLCQLHAKCSSLLHTQGVLIM